MPCLCPQAAPSQAALWITDDILAATWRRFTHIYNSTGSYRHRHRLDGGRRHGSNVPGPLEARRRLAKRRMGLTAHSGPSNPSGGDLGALFGFGMPGATREDAESGWRWQAPKLQNTEVAREGGWNSAWSYCWPGRAPKRKEQQAWEKFLEAPGQEIAANHGLAHGCEAEDVDPLFASSEAFGKLLADLEAVEELRAEDLADVVTFLQSTADEVDAKNPSRLVSWIGDRGWVQDAAFDPVMEVLKNKIRLGTLPTDESADILQILVHALPPTAPDFARLVSLMQALQQQDMLTEVCATTTRLLIEESTMNDQPSPAINLWLNCLRSIRTGPKSSSPSMFWPGVYEQLSRKYSRPAMLCEHLSALEETELATVLLRYWVLQLSTLSSLSTQDLADGMIAGAVNITYETSGKSGESDEVHLAFPSPSPKHITLLFNHWENLLSHRQQNHRRSRPLIDLLYIIAYHRYPYAELASDIFTILVCASSSSTNRDVFLLYRKLRENPALGIPSALGAQLIHHFLSTGDLRYALYVFRSVPGLPLGQFHPLAMALAADSSSVPSSAIWYVLNRNTPKDVMSRPALGAAKKPLLLQPSHIDLVHDVAFAFAKQETLPPRVAFRRVWECYRFLKDRSAPVGSLISRALVTAGVIRPLKLGMRVPTEQLRFVLTVIEMIEGKEVAEQLDRVVLEIWTREVLPSVLKATREGLEVNERNEGSETWRSVAWARKRNGKNNSVRVRNDNKGADALNTYEPFTLSNDNGDASGSSPRAGADRENVSELNAEPVGVSYSAATFGLSRAASTLGEAMSVGSLKSTGVDTEPLPQWRAPIRRGLGYEAFNPPTAKMDNKFVAEERKGYQVASHGCEDPLVSSSPNSTAMLKAPMLHDDGGILAIQGETGYHPISTAARENSIPPPILAEPEEGHVVYNPFGEFIADANADVNVQKVTHG